MAERGSILPGEWWSAMGSQTSTRFTVIASNGRSRVDVTGAVGAVCTYLLLLSTLLPSLSSSLQPPSLLPWPPTGLRQHGCSGRKWSWIHRHYSHTTLVHLECISSMLRITSTCPVSSTRARVDGQVNATLPQIVEEHPCLPRCCRGRIRTGPLCPTCRAHNSRSAAVCEDHQV